MKKIRRLLAMLRWIPAIAAFFLRKRSVAPVALIVTPLKLGDFCMWMITAPELLAHYSRRNLRTTLLIAPELLPMAEKMLDFDAAIPIAYPDFLYSWRMTGDLRRQLDGKFGVAVATAVERSFCRDDLPRIFTRAAEFHSASAVPLAEKFWGRMSLWADRCFFRNSTIALPNHLRTPEAVNYQRLHSAMTGGEIVPRAFGSATGTGTILAPFASDPARCWPLENFAAILPHLPRPVTIVGGSADREAAERLSGSGVVNRCGETTLEEVTEIIRQCELVVGVDSGIANLGILLGKKVLAAASEAHRRFMILPEQFTRYGFRLPVRITAEVPCPDAGCNYHCPRVRVGETYPCVAEITVAAFLRALSESAD